MKHLRKISVLVLTLMMVLTMGASVFAVNSDGTVNTDKGIESKDTTIGIAKQIVFVNAEDTMVREPNITYTYTIESADPSGATITDKDGVTGTVKAGIMAAVKGAKTDTTSEIVFADTATSQATNEGQSTASKYANFTFDASKFTVNNVLTPGIYRYKITESTNVTKASVGITEAATYAPVRYLDVYVQWTDENRTELEVYGYVLYEGGDSQTIASGSVSMKSPGYVNTATASGSQSDVDVYKTQNLHVEKKTTGAMADPANDFPVTLSLTAANGVTATPKLDVVLGVNGTVTGTSSDTVGTYITFAASIGGTVDNGSSFDLKGIPEGATVSLVEKNNTPDSYKVKAGKTADAGDLLTEAVVAAGANSGATTVQTLNDKVSIFITNTLNAISPTNVVMRFAPYLFILGGAVMLLIVSRRRRSEEE